MKFPWFIVPTGLAVQCLAAQGLVLSPGFGLALPNPNNYVFVSSSGAESVKFKYAGVSSYANLVPNFVVVVPTSGTTPAVVRIGLNPSVLPYLQPGVMYTTSTISFTTVGQTPASTVTEDLILQVPPEPSPAVQSVGNAASLEPLLSPGAIASIFGSHLTGPTLSTNYDDTASYPTSVANTSVTFNGTAAPLLYMSPSQISVIVPFALAGQKSAQLVVTRFNQVSSAFTVALQDTSPGIFTAGLGGTGQAAIQQQGPRGQFSYNSLTNPAPAGSALEIFATGAGVWTPLVQSDIFVPITDLQNDVAGTFTTQPVSVTIGGQPAKVLYAGTQGGQSTWSILQVNVVLPGGLASGPQSVVLKIGANDSSAQNVTVWVQ